VESDHIAAGDTEIYLWHGDTISTISSDTTDDYGPAISGRKAAWYGRTVGIYEDYEIFMNTVPRTIPVPALTIAGLLVTAGLLGLGGWRRLRR